MDNLETTLKEVYSSPYKAIGQTVTDSKGYIIAKVEGVMLNQADTEAAARLLASAFNELLLHL